MPPTRLLQARLRINRLIPTANLTPARTRVAAGARVDCPIGILLTLIEPPLGADWPKPIVTVSAAAHSVALEHGRGHRHRRVAATNRSSWASHLWYGVNLEGR